MGHGNKTNFNLEQHNFACVADVAERFTLASESPNKTPQHPHQRLFHTARRREVEAAQAGAATERAARAAAEAALSEARVLLRDTGAFLQESLANGPRAALAALMEEKEAAEAAAATAIEQAAAETRALKEKRREELLLLKTERDEVTECSGYLVVHVLEV